MFKSQEWTRLSTSTLNLVQSHVIFHFCLFFVEQFSVNFLLPKFYQLLYRCKCLANLLRSTEKISCKSFFIHWIGLDSFETPCFQFRLTLSFAFSWFVAEIPLDFPVGEILLQLYMFNSFAKKCHSQEKISWKSCVFART